MGNTNYTKEELTYMSSVKKKVKGLFDTGAAAKAGKAAQQSNKRTSNAIEDIPNQVGANIPNQVGGSIKNRGTP